MRIPQQILDSVVFIGTLSKDGEQFQAGGTTFFVSLNSSAVPRMNFVYLVTAKHNVERAKNIGPLYVSINSRDGGAGVLMVSEEWHYSEDEASDVAILPFLPSTEYFDFKSIPLENSLTDDIIRKYEIGPGEDVAVVGLFTSHPGKAKNLPVVRTGNIAMMPLERLRDEDSGFEYESYLIEIHSISGLSGSPVFLYAWGREIEGRYLEGKIFLLGLVRSHWKFDPTEDAIQVFGTELREFNTGIANVTPIRDLLTIIDSEHFAKLRREQETQILRASTAKT